jgi:hypothetical protein
VISGVDGFFSCQGQVLLKVIESVKNLMRANVLCTCEILEVGFV